MKSTKGSIKAQGEQKGYKITVNAEICNSWGFMGNRKAIIDMAQVLAESGYDVEYSIEAVPGGTGIFIISIILKDGTKKVIYSNDSQYKDAIINYTSKTKMNEIIQKIVESTK